MSELKSEAEIAVHRRLNLLNGENLTSEELVMEAKGLVAELRDIFRKEQKPTEWSEEDGKRWKNVLRLITEANDRYIREQGRSPFSSDILWLKSLRPSWKPSEEQMKVLKIACTIREGERNYYLHTLLDDLQKL